MPKSKPTRTRAKRAQTLTLWTALVLVVAGLGLGLLWLRTSSPTVTVEEGGFQLALQPSRGNHDAPVKVVEFGDFKCPACKAFHQDVYPRLVSDFVWQDQVEFYFINFQFLAPDSVTAGIAGECLYQQNEDAFWRYFDLMYDNQGPESQPWAAADRLLPLVEAQLPGVNMAALRSCMDDEAMRQRVEQDRQIGQRAGVRGTPTLFVNGVKLDNWSYAALSAAIRRQLGQTP